MAEEIPLPPSVEAIEAIKLFNEFQSQSRARAEATLKLIMVVSGGMLTLSVGAVLNGVPAKIPSNLLPMLQEGWMLLFFCIAASVLLMCTMIVATFHMGIKMRKVLEGKNKNAPFEFVATWPLLRIFNGLLALSILCSFLLGIYLICRVAIGVAGNITTPTSAQSTATQMCPALAFNPSHPHKSSGNANASAEIKIKQ